MKKKENNREKKRRLEIPSLRRKLIEVTKKNRNVRKTQLAIPLNLKIIGVCRVQWSVNVEWQKRSVNTNVYEVRVYGWWFVFDFSPVPKIVYSVK